MRMTDLPFQRRILIILLGLAIAAVAVAGLGIAEQAGAAASSKLRAAGEVPVGAERLEGTLLDLYLGATQAEAAGAPGGGGGSRRLAEAIERRQLRIDGAGRVQVEATIVGAGPVRGALDALGVVVERWRLDLGRAQLQAPPSALVALAKTPGVRFVGLPTYAVSSIGSTLSEGDAALRADLVRAEQGLSGAGVRVGVISNGIDGLAAAQASGDAPVLADQRAFDSQGLEAGSEGTAMIEIVHDLAPGAEILFANAATDLDMIEAVNYLAERADVVVDDLGFLFPDDQQSAVSVNTAAALNNPAWPIRGYVTSVGNWARRHYSGSFVAGPDGETLGLPFSGAVHLFEPADGTTDALGRVSTPYNEIYLETGDQASVVVFWDDPWGGSANDYDVYLLNAANVEVASSGLGQGTTAVNPRERLSFTNDGPGGFFRIVVQNFEDGAATRALEIFVFDAPLITGGASVLNFNTVASSLLGQNDAGGGVISVGAIDHRDAGLDDLEAFSSRGPTNNGVNKPDVTAIDGVSVTGSGGFQSPFFGTSAAAPHVAAVAALVLEARPSLLASSGGSPGPKRALLRALLLNSAVDLGQAGTDNESGTGRLDAVLALEQAANNIFTVSSDADAGAGSLREAIVAVNASTTDGSASSAILFDGTFTIVLATPLPPLTADNLTLDGAGSVIEGGALTDLEASPGLVMRGTNVRVSDLTLQNFGGAGMHLDGASVVVLTSIGLARNGTGLLIDGGANGVTIGDEVTRGVTVTESRGDGVVLSGAGTSGVVIQNSLIGVNEAGEAAGNAGSGVRIMDGASGNVVGAVLSAAVGFQAAQAEALVHTFQGVVLINGLPAPTGTLVEAFIDGNPAGATSVGVVSVDGQPGFVLTVRGPGGTVTFSVDGVESGDAVAFEAGTLTTLTLSVTIETAAPERAVLGGGNVIAYNAGNGIRIEGAASLGNTLRANEIHSNGALGIDLVSASDPASGVTPNDATDGDSGANTLLNAPRLTKAEFVDVLATVSGSAPTGLTIDLYAVVDGEAAPEIGADPSGAGGALRFLGSAVAASGRFEIGKVLVEGATVLTALATDESGNTSEFATNLVIGEGPSIVNLIPSNGSRDGGTLVTIVGEGFGSGTGLRVFLGGNEAVVVSATPSVLVVRTPPGSLGATPLKVTNPDGRSAVLVDAFTYTAVRTVLLQPGWNNVVWSGATTPITAAISSLAGSIDRVFGWDSSGQRFDSFIVAAPAFVNTLTALQPDQIVWLFVTSRVAVRWEQPLPQ